MAKYALTCLDFELPNGMEFTATFCGYSGKVRLLVIGNDPLRHLRSTSVSVTGVSCQAGKHCLALKCKFNKTPTSHLAHLLEMMVDEPLDDETASACGTTSSVDFLVQLADKMGKYCPEELRGKKLAE